MSNTLPYSHLLSQSISEPPQARKLIDKYVERVCELYPDAYDKKKKKPYVFGDSLENIGKNVSRETTINNKKLRVNINTLENGTGVDLTQLLVSAFSIAIAFNGKQYFRVDTGEELSHDHDQGMKPLEGGELRELLTIKQQILAWLLTEYRNWKNVLSGYSLQTDQGVDEDAYGEFPGIEWRLYEKVSIK